MMESNLQLPGIEDETTKKEIGLKRFVKVEVKTARVVDVISRGAGDAAATPVPSDVKNDDIVEMDFENGGRRWKQWMTFDQLRELQQPRVSRGNGDHQEEQFFIPNFWEAEDTSRGLGMIALKALKIFGIDTQDKFAEKGAQKLAASIADYFESQIEKQGHPFGLYWFADPMKIEAKQLIRDAKKLTGSEPFLVFLHGTASSSIGSFGKLAGTGEWKKLQEIYGDRILALEHRTFSVSPIQNALDLANLLPDGARLHLVSHSRGGLVGELICLAQAGDSRTKFEEFTQAFKQKSAEDDSLRAVREKQCKDLETLWDLLLQKKFLVDRFVRVACPAHGTTLASKRMDYLASGILNAVGLIPGIEGNPVLEVGYDWLKSLLLTLVKKKADPHDLPGIEAMVPDSPLIEFLNQSALITDSDLGVLSGDIEVGNLKLTIPALIGNSFFWAKNDLVVNTRSMYDGIRRKAKGYFFFDQGSLVCHFNYFSNSESRTKLVEWLVRKDDAVAENFRELQRGVADARDMHTVGALLEKEEPVAAEAPVYTLQVSVSHGDLWYAKYPVAVGHYDGDGIVSAEKYLDRLLSGRLADRMDMRLYPGPVGTAEVIYGPRGSSPSGAIVIGLGEMGGMTAEIVEQGVTSAALRHALMIAERSDSSQSRKYRSAAFSSLLIGTYGGSSLRVKDSINAILRGAMNANRVLYQQRMWDRVRIDKLELIEIYEDVAIQAIHAVHDLSGDKSFDFAQEVTINVEPKMLRPSGGGRYQRPLNEFDTYWYSRIQIAGVQEPGEANGRSGFAGLPKIFSLDTDRQITQRSFIDKLIDEAVKTPKKRQQLSEIITELLTQDGTRSSRGAGLEFLVLTDRARVEASLQTTQRRLVDMLVEDSIGKTSYDKELSISLFEMLIPNELKDHTDNVVLLLDRESAQYPWELMTDRTRPNDPLSVRMGILRQFRTGDFRINPRPSRGNYALVIGDTKNSGLAELPGAKMEAEAVAKLLEESRYDVLRLIKDNGKTIINGLYARECQILHIAAHGSYNAVDPDQSGVVLGDGCFLTAKEMVNLRTVPDLVFINCCHLGKVDREENPRLESDSPHRLAASVAEELIKMGVKVVVAAGWAVNDAAAMKFAQVFYEQMLSGEAFGKAVLQARRDTHREYADTNTWGAYQCYGNPNFRLNMLGGGGRRKNGLYSRREYRDELKGIAESPLVQNEKRNKGSRKRLKELEDLLKLNELSPNLLSDGEILSDFGEAWYSLGNFQEAIDFYKKAVYTKDAKASLRAIERLANLECRYALQVIEKESRQATEAAKKTRAEIAAAKAQREKIREMLVQARGLFAWLLSLEETSERYALAGKAHKCLAMVAENKAEREENLKEATESYQKGSMIAREKSERAQDWLYPAVNYIACSWLSPGAKKTELLPYIEECRKEWRQAAKGDADIWLRVMKPDLDLLYRLVSGSLAKSQKEMINAYKEALGHGVKPSEAESVLTQFKFLTAMLKSGSKPQPEAKQADALDTIMRELLRFTDSSNG